MVSEELFIIDLLIEVPLLGHQFLLILLLLLAALFIPCHVLSLRCICSDFLLLFGWNDRDWLLLCWFLGLFLDNGGLLIILLLHFFVVCGLGLDFNLILMLFDLFFVVKRSLLFASDGSLRGFLGHRRLRCVVGFNGWGRGDWSLPAGVHELVLEVGWGDIICGRRVIFNLNCCGCMRCHLLLLGNDCRFL